MKEHRAEKKVYTDGLRSGTIVLSCLDCGKGVPAGRYGQKNPADDRDEGVLRDELNELECIPAPKCHHCYVEECRYKVEEGRWYPLGEWPSICERHARCIYCNDTIPSSILF